MGEDEKGNTYCGSFTITDPYRYSREQYGMLGSNHTLLSANMSTAADQSPGSNFIPLNSHAPLDGVLTTIVLPPGAGDDTADNDLSFLLAAMPSRKDSDMLVAECEFTYRQSLAQRDRPDLHQLCRTCTGSIT